MLKYTFILSILLVSSYNCFAQSYSPDLLRNLTFAELDSIVMQEYTKSDIHNPIIITRYSREKAVQKFGKMDSLYTEYTNRMGFFLHIAGQLEEAEGYFLEALELKKQIFGKEHTEYGVTLNNLAAIYLDLGNYKQAEPLFLENIQLQEKLSGKAHPNYIQSIGNLGAFYVRTNKLEKAKKIYKTLLATAPSSMVIYYSLMSQYGSIFVKTKEYEQAEKILLEALKGKEKKIGRQHRLYAKTLLNLAGLYRIKKQYPTSLKYYEQAKDIQLQLTGKFHPSYITLLQGMATLHFEQKQFNKAISYTKESLAANCKKPMQIVGTRLKTSNFIYHKKAVESIKIWMQILNQQYQKAPSTALATQIRQLSQKAIELNILIKNSFEMDQDKINLLEENNYFATMGIQSSIRTDDDKLIQQAFDFAEQNKSILLADALRGTKAKQLGYLPDSLAKTEKTLRQAVKVLQKSIAQAKDSITRNNLLAQMGSIHLKIDAFKQKVQYEYPAYHSLKYQNELISVADIQQRLEENTALLEYFVSDSSSFLFVVTKNNFKIHPIPVSKRELVQHSKRLRQALSNYPFILNNETAAFQKYTSEASWFYENWVKVGLPKQSTITNLTIITDNVLGHLPFEVFLTTLPTEQHNLDYTKLNYLIKEYSINYNYSATLWKHNQDMLVAQNTGKILALAASYPPLDSNQVRALRQPYTYQIRKHLSPIPKVKEEVAALERNFVGTFVQDQSANEQFFKQNATTYNIIHLAMHGILNTRTPILSSLAFSENYDSTENNFLHTYEIADLDLKAQLVTLSACETGYGKFEQGEGVLSLARSFMYAGVPALVVSLWQVNDQSTAILMPLFYTNIANGMSKDKALQQAKLTYLKNNTGVAAHPAFWSAFIQLGDPSSIELKTKPKASFYWTIGSLIIVCLLLLFWLIYRKK
jgi:CHAT domain-containing protein/tetratricopeptide (TPR) repeat protein